MQVQSMGIVDTTAKRILDRFDLRVLDERHAEGVPGRVLLDENVILEIEQDGGLLEEVFCSEMDILGLYTPMSSPGIISLNLHNLSSFFWSLALGIYKKGYFMERQDFEKLSHMVVLKTYTHEQFHHFCNVCRYMFGGSFDKMKEEALAVAWSYLQVNVAKTAWASKEARLASPLYYEMMKAMYQYKSPGYRDWKHFRSRDDLSAANTRYCGPTSSIKLELNGIDIGVVLLKILDEVKDKGVVEILE